MGLEKWKITPPENLEGRASRDYHLLSNWSRVCRDKKHLVRSRTGPPVLCSREPVVIRAGQPPNRIRLPLVALVNEQLHKNHGPIISGGCGSQFQLIMTDRIGLSPE